MKYVFGMGCGVIFFALMTGNEFSLAFGIACVVFVIAAEIERALRRGSQWTR